MDAPIESGSPKTRFLVVGSLSCALGVFVVAIGYFYFPGREPRLPSVVPPSFALGDQEGVHSKILVPYGTSRVYVEFSQINSGTDVWDGSNARLTILEPYIATSDGATHHETWRTIVTFELTSTYFRPWLRANLHIDEKYCHIWLKAKAELTVNYPKGRDRYYHNESEHLCRPFELLVLTPEEYQVVQRHANWIRDDDAYFISHFLLYPFGVLLLGIGFCFAVIKPLSKTPTN